MSLSQIRASKRDRLTIALGLIAIAVSAAIKLGNLNHAPLWLDEAWTGAIIGEPHLKDFLAQLYWDVNPPFYYILMRGWELVFGLSDAALRAPSLIASLATPLLPLLLLRRDEAGERARDGVGSPTVFCWAGLLALWIPGFDHVQEARCYSILLFLCTAQAVAFVRLAHRPNSASTAAWSALAALAILTHYYAAPMIALELVILVATRRVALRSLWPAVLILSPVAAWMAIHYPRVAEFARPDVAWYHRLQLRDVGSTLAEVMDGPLVLSPVLAVVILAALSGRLGGRWPRLPDRLSVAMLLVFASAFSAVAMTLLGLARPSLTPKYLTPYAPGCLLGLAALLGWLGQRRAAWARAAILGLFIAIPCYLALEGRLPRLPAYEFETASKALALAKPKRVAFLLDNPNAAILTPQQLRALGGFFFRREGLSPQIVPVVLRPGENPNARLGGELQQGDALIWLYDLDVPGTHAKLFPPALQGVGSTLKCQTFDPRFSSVIGCLDGLSFQTEGFK